VIESVTDIIASRAHEPDGLGRMLPWSIGAHLAVAVALLLWPDRSVSEPPKQIMTISLGGAPGPKTGGLTQAGAQAVQAPPPPEPVKQVEAPPAPKAPPMTLPDPKVRPRQAPKPTQAPPDASAKTPNTGAEPKTGAARGDTRVRGTGFGLSSSGGSGGPVQLDVIDFCCPEYIDQMRLAIMRGWDPNQGVVGSTTMKFTITRSGGIQSSQVELPSGFVALDNAAVRALQLARLPPLPAEFANPTLTVHLRFDYQR
jgi:periplasmic protein TonB